MKTSIKNLLLPSALVGGLVLMLAGPLTAQTFTTLHSFTTTPCRTNSDGCMPAIGRLILSGNTLYGVAPGGGSSGSGTVFKLNTDGSGFARLHSFTAVPGQAPLTNSDGFMPGSVILSGNTLYGTASSGGISGNGTVFAINTDGTGFTTLYSFTAESDGGGPRGLILSSNTLYGLAYLGGSSGVGTVFKVNTDGTGFTTLYSFTGGSDGNRPGGYLTLSGNTLYGTTYWGGIWDNGSVFAVKTDGTGFTTRYNFTAPDPDTGINSDGAEPSAGLVLSGNTLYGTAKAGGGSGNGTVFAVNTDGTGFTTLYNFTANDPNTGINSDGAWPEAELVLSGHTLYGTAYTGGSSGNGTVFAVNTDGTGFKTLYSFTAPSGYNVNHWPINRDGAYPEAGLILSRNTLYGTARLGGNSAEGTVFSLSLGSVSAPQLTIIPSGASVILTWPANATGFTLESTTNLLPPAVWTPVSPGPVVVNGQNAVTNAISGTQQFFRLSQQ